MIASAIVASSNFPLREKSRLVQLAGAIQRQDMGSRGRVGGGALAHLGLDPARRLRDRVPHEPCLGGIGGLKLLSHGLRGLLEQREHVLARNLGANPDRESKTAIALRPFDQRRIAVMGKSRARILGHAHRHRAVAAFDQEVGDRFGQNPAARDRQEVALALGPGALDQCRFVEPIGMRQDRLRHLDRVVEREPAQHAGRRVGNGRHAAAEARARGDLELRQQTAHHVVEQRDLLAGEAARSGHEKVGHLSQNLCPPPDVRLAERIIELRDQVGLRVHELAPPSSWRRVGVSPECP
jgi:hypothetical protein